MAILLQQQQEKIKVNKCYSEMNRIERREYKRWLAKNNIWCGDVLVENWERNQKYHQKNLNQNQNEST